MPAKAAIVQAASCCFIGQTQQLDYSVVAILCVYSLVYSCLRKVMLVALPQDVVGGT